MGDNNIVPLEIIKGWCIALLAYNTPVPQLFWNRDQKGFNGLVSIYSIFENEHEAIKQAEEFLNNPYMKCEVFEVEHIYTGMDRDIAINIKIGDTIIKM